MAGDAAHLFPSPGVALGAGLLDSVNLGWKLAADIHGWAPDGLLDTYHDERRLAAARNMLHAQAQVAIRRGHDAAAVALRELFQELLADEQPLRRLGGLMAGSELRYPFPGHDHHALIGTFAPDLALRTDRGATSVAELMHGGAARLPRPRRPPGPPRDRPGLAASHRHPHRRDRSPTGRRPPDPPGRPHRLGRDRSTNPPTPPRPRCEKRSPAGSAHLLAEASFQPSSSSRRLPAIHRSCRTISGISEADLRQVAHVQRDRVDRCSGLHRRRPALRIDQRDLPDHLARAERREPFAVARDLDAPRFQDEHVVGHRALPDQDVAGEPARRRGAIPRGVRDRARPARRTAAASPAGRRPSRPSCPSPPSLAPSPPRAGDPRRSPRTTASRRPGSRSRLLHDHRRTPEQRLRAPTGAPAPRGSRSMRAPRGQEVAAARPGELDHRAVRRRVDDTRSVPVQRGLSSAETSGPGAGQADHEPLVGAEPEHARRPVVHDRVRLEREADTAPPRRGRQRTSICDRNGHQCGSRWARSVARCGQGRERAARLSHHVGCPSAS